MDVFLKQEKKENIFTHDQEWYGLTLALYLCAIGEVFFTFAGHHDAYVQNFKYENMASSRL
jgi:mannose-6-phosphate isomerase class I